MNVEADPAYLRQNLNLRGIVHKCYPDGIASCSRGVYLVLIYYVNE
jgi:hypothetical protein